MAKTLTATIDAKINWQYLNDENISTPQDIDQNRSKVEMGSGGGSKSLEIMYRERAIVTPSTPNHDIDLASVVDVFGDTLTFTEVLSLQVKNLATTTGNHLLVGAAVASAWTTPFDGSSTAKIRCGAESPLIFADVVDGLAVGGGSGSVLRIAHNGVSTDDIEFDIVIVGHET